jgi:hypothetical protein
MIEIKGMLNKEVLFTSKFDTLKEALEEAAEKRVSLSGADLTGANLSHLNAPGIDLEFAFLEGADLSGANLEGANLEDAMCERVDFTGANLKGANLAGVNFTCANFSEVKIEGAFIIEGIEITGRPVQTTLLGENEESFDFWPTTEGIQFVASGSCFPVGHFDLYVHEVNGGSEAITEFLSARDYAVKVLNAR